MSFDPETLLGLQNSRQNQSSLELQREILAMQKLQVLNQVRISQGLPPLAQLPQPPQAPPLPTITHKKVKITKFEILFLSSCMIVHISPWLLGLFVWLFGR
jgi:hypothetical protein